jgi:hypothetical protein
VDAALDTRRVGNRHEDQHRPASADGVGAVPLDGEQQWEVETPGGPVVANESVLEAEPDHPRPALGGTASRS